MKTEKHLKLVKKTIFIFKSNQMGNGRSTEPTTSVTSTITSTDSLIRPITG